MVPCCLGRLTHHDGDERLAGAAAAGPLHGPRALHLAQLQAQRAPAGVDAAALQLQLRLAGAAAAAQPARRCPTAAAPPAATVHPTDRRNCTLRGGTMQRSLDESVAYIVQALQPKMEW